MNLSPCILILFFINVALSEQVRSYNSRFSGMQHPKAAATANNTLFLGDGICQTDLNIQECGYDGGECMDFNIQYPACQSLGQSINVTIDPTLIVYGICDGGVYNTEVSGFEGGDCEDACRAVYFTKECGYDGGDCYKPVPGYPECLTHYPDLVGDGACHQHLATPECGNDDGDCDNFVLKTWSF
jgi:hypothetical protein